MVKIKQKKAATKCQMTPTALLRSVNWFSFFSFFEFNIKKSGEKNGAFACIESLAANS